MSMLVLSVSSNKSQRPLSKKGNDGCVYEEIGGKHYGGPVGKKISWLFFFPNGSTEWTQCVSMGPPAARELWTDPKDYKYRDLCVLCGLERVERAGER